MRSLLVTKAAASLSVLITVKILGQALAPTTVTLSPTSVGGTVTTSVVTLTNSGGDQLAGIKVVIGGTNKDSFSQTNDCGGALAKNASCEITITFGPKVIGANAGTLSVTGSSAINPTTVTLTGTATASAKPSSYTFSLKDNSTVSVGEKKGFLVKAVDATGNVLSAFSGDVTLETTDSGAALNPAKLTLSKGVASSNVTFVTAGTQSLFVSEDTSSEVKLIVTTGVAGCSSCFATIGAGAAIFHTDSADYVVTQNVLQQTHLGSSTPQYLIGVAYKLPWQTMYGIKFGTRSLYTRLGCTPGDFGAPNSEAKAAYCYPFKAFANLKFTPDSSQTFTGFTYGISHALHKNLDVLIGLSYTPYSEVSPGFLAAAQNTFATQTAAKNPCYAQFTSAQLQDPDHYDGFPTQLLTNTGTASAPICTAGSQIYSGNALVTHHHSGVFFGIAVPINFKSFLGGN